MASYRISLIAHQRTEDDDDIDSHPLRSERNAARPLVTTYRGWGMTPTPSPIVRTVGIALRNRCGERPLFFDER